MESNFVAKFTCDKMAIYDSTKDQQMEKLKLKFVHGYESYMMIQIFEFQCKAHWHSLVMKIPFFGNNNSLKASRRICSPLWREMTKWFDNMYPLDGCFLHRWSLVSIMT